MKSSPSVLSKSLVVKGELVSKGILEIEGQVSGNIKSKVLTLRESSNVEGDIFAETLNAKGRFNGTIKAKNINISDKAHIIGNIEYFSLSVEDGAKIDGQFKQIGNPDELLAGKEDK